jgi:hypothetical protein
MKRAQKSRFGDFLLLNMKIVKVSAPIRKKEEGVESDSD